MFKKKGGGGQRLFEQCLKKTALLVADGFSHIISAARGGEGVSQGVSFLENFSSRS